MLKTSFASLIGISFAIHSPAHSQDWREADANGDGVLTMEEVPAPLQAFFGRVDTNGDQKLDEKELEAAARRLQQVNRENRKAPSIQLPEGVKVQKDRVYREGHDRWKVDVYLPESASILVSEGQRVLAGETVLADFAATESPRMTRRD